MHKMPLELGGVRSLRLDLFVLAAVEVISTPKMNSPTSLISIADHAVFLQRRRAVAGLSHQNRHAPVYLANTSLDRDHDGVECEVSA